MPANKPTMARTCKSDLAKVDAHVIQPREYDEIPEFIDEDMSRGVLKRGGRPVAANPRKQVTIRLPADVLARWRATGKGWQTRLAAAVEKQAPAAGNATMRKRRAPRS